MNSDVWLLLPAPGEPMLVTSSKIQLDLGILTNAVQLWPWKKGDLTIWADDPREAHYAPENPAASELAGTELRGPAVAVHPALSVEGWQQLLPDVDTIGLPVEMDTAILRRELASSHGSWIGVEVTDEEAEEIVLRAILGGPETLVMAVHLAEGEE